MTVSTPAPVVASRGLGQGITVHGWWTIDVRDSNGALVRHTEFENALSPGAGDVALAQLLGAQLSLGSWQVHADDGILAVSGHSLDFSSNTADQSVGDAPITVVANNGQLVLKGSATPTQDFSIARVSSAVATCSPGQAPTTQGCPSGSGPTFSFSSAQLLQPVPVAEGQLVNVTITFSFS